MEQHLCRTAHASSGFALTWRLPKLFSPVYLRHSATLHSLPLCCQARAPKTSSSKTPTGGAKRAFVRLNTLGAKGRPDFMLLNEMYKRAKREESQAYKTAVSMAAAARKVAALGLRRAAGSVFGRNSRTVRKSKMKSVRGAVCERVQGLGPEQRFTAIGDHIVKMGLSMKESLSLARTTLRMDAARMRANQEAAMEQLEAFRAGRGAEAIAKLVTEVPGLSAFQLRAEPLGPCLAIEVLPPATDTVIDSAAWAQSALGTNLAANLEEFWKQRHQAVLPTHAPTASTSAESHSVSLCFSAGVCLCSEQGKIVKELGCLFLALMRRTFPNHSEEKALLVSGSIVVRFSGAPSSEDYDAILADPAAFGELVLHIGLQYLNPYRPTFMKVEDSTAEGEIAADVGRRYVKVTFGRALSQRFHGQTL